jgi:transmembrane protein 222
MGVLLNPQRDAGEKVVNSREIQPECNRFPLCIVWTPLPYISWIFPFIGHTGLCDADGIIYDFAGPYYIYRHGLDFGVTHKYVRLNIPED